MTKTKNYNQIFFLTTLSVYLGLVLVGASPQVLAQAALTKDFNLKIECESRDDLDKKPESSESESIESITDFDLITNAVDKFVSQNFPSSEVENYRFVFERENFTKSGIEKDLAKDNSPIYFKNPQLQIVTRLPRGSIDSLTK